MRHVDALVDSTYHFYCIVRKDGVERHYVDLKEVPRGTLAELWVRLARWRKDHLSDARSAEDAYAKALEIDTENLEILRDRVAGMARG